ncbi:hypothetical protein JNB63_02095 [Microbacterium trichothecenolyticum]|uniref:hypothetical protein n=1 Tax=Microbacterium trichothecenolyticum TaxID=69370 RepID=UPI001C6DEE12|nr:hypothetical protein [Microbacterium trichothecenolyticum]MBW9118877.1 hypothetical protein [Microbacterium trichothecenolyticum]
MKRTEILTTLLELFGLVLIVAGVWLAFGLAVALIVAGVLSISLSFLLYRGGRS